MQPSRSPSKYEALSRVVLTLERNLVGIEIAIANAKEDMMRTKQELTKLVQEEQRLNEIAKKEAEAEETRKATKQKKDEKEEPKKP
jgi:hypothetical protein